MVKTEELDKTDNSMIFIERDTALDELPEAFNIAKGDMSILGPRPLLPSYLPWYTERERHRHGMIV